MRQEVMGLLSCAKAVRRAIDLDTSAGDAVYQAFKDNRKKLTWKADGSDRYYTLFWERKNEKISKLDFIPNKYLNILRSTEDYSGATLAFPSVVVTVGCAVAATAIGWL
eukprot:GHVS01085922.1.p1 GENE.GHVS01085922.1~~GHVS01085922.1.p1  ORF type:complete len:109 (-),score=10.28 GHVS01085922.1:245-571(-)